MSCWIVSVKQRAAETRQTETGEQRGFNQCCSAGDGGGGGGKQECESYRESKKLQNTEHRTLFKRTELQGQTVGIVGFYKIPTLSIRHWFEKHKLNTRVSSPFSVVEDIDAGLKYSFVTVNNLH